MLSLRKRALIGGALTAVIVLAVGTYLLYSLMGTIALSRFDSTLQDRHTQLIIALNDAQGDPAQLSENIFDPPSFSHPFFGALLAGDLPRWSGLHVKIHAERNA